MTKENSTHRILLCMLQCIYTGMKALISAGERQVPMNINAELPHSLSMEHEIRRVIMSAYAGKDLLRPSPFRYSESASRGVKFPYIVTLTPSPFCPYSVLCLYRSVILNCYLVRNTCKPFKFLMWL